MNRFIKFMYGRYGIDELFKFLFYLYLVIVIINLFIRNIFLSYLEILIIIVMFYRFFSKKIYKRSDENQKYLKIKNKFLNHFKVLRKNIKDKDYIYKKCRKCKTILKLPLPDKKGIKHSKCPKCKKRLTIICLKHNKIEIIKRRKK